MAPECWERRRVNTIFAGAAFGRICIHRTGPESWFPFAWEKMDANGGVHEPKTKEKIREVLEALAM